MIEKDKKNKISLAGFIKVYFYIYNTRIFNIAKFYEP